MLHGQLREIIIKDRVKGTSHTGMEMAMVMGRMATEMVTDMEMVTGMEMVTAMEMVLELKVQRVHKVQRVRRVHKEQMVPMALAQK